MFVLQSSTIQYKDHIIEMISLSVMEYSVYDTRYGGN